jgi:TolB-like protein
VSFLAELKRRNVFRVAVAYAVVGWLLAQISDVALNAFQAPDWVPKTVLLLLVLGFPLVIMFAWAFELTPEGVKREKDVDRTASITRETGRKLDRVIIGVLVIAVGFLLIDKFVIPDASNSETTATSVGTIDKSVAVLPFVAMSTGPEDAYFADGLTEEILNSLAQLPELLVTARTSAFAFKGQDVPIPEIALKLGVAHVVEGSVRRAGDRLRVTAQLIRAADGFHLWSQTYERPTTDSFGVQDEIARNVATALDVVLDEERLESMRAVGLRNPEAFVVFQQAREGYARAHELHGPESRAAFRNANALLEQALALEPGFGRAYFTHADYFVHLAAEGGEDGPLTDTEVVEALARAEADYRNAIKYAMTEGERLNATLELALVSRQFARLTELIDSAAQSTGCLSMGWWSVVNVLLPSLDAPMALTTRKQQCDPLLFSSWRDSVDLLLANGEFRAAIEVSQRGLEKIRHRQIANSLIRAYIAAGEYDKALAANERLIENNSVRQAHRLDVAMAQGNVEDVEPMREAILASADAARDLRVAKFITIYARSGMRDKVNEFAASIDAEPVGFLALLEAVTMCNCGAPWDIEATPNLKRLLDEAGLIWPPREPVDWPLKTW